MRLRYIETVSFARSELTNFLDILRRRPEFGRAGHMLALGKDDVVVLVSKMGNQLIFVSGFTFLERGKRETHKLNVLRSVRLRLSGSTHWNPLMLADYAKRVGIELKGLKLYEDYIKAKLEKGT